MPCRRLEDDLEDKKSYTENVFSASSRRQMFPRTSTHQRHNTERESPFPLYIRLEIHSFVKNNNAINLLMDYVCCMKES